MTEARIGVFGGSGFYSLLDGAETVEVDTPYGDPSAPPVVGSIGPYRVAFIPRHGVMHEFPPHAINYRANLWAMKELGVERIVGPCAAGSLQPGVKIGDFVVCDQVVDRTRTRPHTFYDGPVTTHISFADPYCATMRPIIIGKARELGIGVHDGGTMVVIEGPRFSTRAESAWFNTEGWHTINMTGYPEVLLARELEICYANVSLITDYDVGVPGAPPVTHEEVVRVFGQTTRACVSSCSARSPRSPPNATASARPRSRTRGSRWSDGREGSGNDRVAVHDPGRSRTARRTHTRGGLVDRGSPGARRFPRARPPTHATEGTSLGVTWFTAQRDPVI